MKTHMPIVSIRMSPAEAALLGSHSFAGLEPKQLSVLVASSWRRKFSRGALIFAEHAPCDSLTLITSGVVKIVRSTPDFVDYILGLFGPRECVGTVAAIHDTPYPASAYAASQAVEVLRIPAAPLRELARTDPAVAAALSRALHTHTQVLMSKIDVVSAGSVAQRLAKLFLTLVERFGDELDSGCLLLPISLSRSDLASLVGATVETVIRTLSSWQKRGLLRTSTTGFELMEPRTLAALAEGIGAARIERERPVAS